MAMKIRLARGGAKKKPFYRIVVTPATAPRDGKFNERLGSYNPMLPAGHADRVSVKEDRVKYWLSVGAKATIRVQKLLADLNIVEKVDYSKQDKKTAPKAKAAARLKEQTDKEQAENAAKEAPVEEAINTEEA